MVGGNFELVRTRCARQLASGLLGGLLVAPWCAPSPAALAAEKSIIVEVAKAPEGSDIETDAADDIAIATDRPADVVYEPIPVTSDVHPDLADPPAAPGAEPTLAEEYLDVVSPRTRAKAARAAATVAAVGESDEASPENTDAIAADATIEDEAAAEEQAAVAIQTASFNGVTPGVTTRAELLRAWGEPASDAGTGRVLTYRLKGFDAVTATLEGDQLTALRVELLVPATTDELVGKLSLAGVRPAVLTDDAGAILTTAFPECGVTFVHGAVNESAIASDGETADAAPSNSQVQVIVLRPIEAALFLRRAATSDARAFSNRIADLETALRFDATSAEARWLLSQAKLATGAAVAAETLAREAVDLEPRSDVYRLQWAACLRRLARYDQSVEQTRIVLESPTAEPLVRAQALEQMGLLAALGSKSVQQQAVPLHTKAIALADTLAAGDDANVSAAAQQLLVGAHLAVAEHIAGGDYENKQEFVAQWISRASALAEQLIESGSADVSLRLQVATCALAAGNRLSSPIDPKMWIEEAEEAAADLQQNLDDDLARAEIDWQLGLAHLYAAELSHRRSDAEAALRYGALAQASLESGKSCRQDLPDTEFVLGRLFFQIGATHAVHRGDHVSACQWYDQAIEPLSQPVPVTLLATPGMHGDALVSMAVSYWEIGDRDRAYELTGAGVELIEQGIAEGLLASDSLKVPQSNFAAMSRALGKAELETPAATPVEIPPQTVQVAETKPAPVQRTTRGTAQRPQVRSAARGVQRR